MHEDLAPVDPMLTAAVMASRTPMVVTDPNRPDNPMVLVNQAFCRGSGYDPPELLGRNCRMLQGPDTDREAVATLRAAIAAVRETTVELLNYRRNGDRFWWEVFLTPVHGPDGRLRYFVASQHDTTERRRAKLWRDPRYAGHAARIASWRWEPASDAMSWSEAASQVFGETLAPASSLAGWAALIHDEDRSGAVRAAHAILTLGQMTFEYRIGRGEAPRWIETAGSVVVRDAAGAPTLVTGIVTDVTQRRAAELDLQAREARMRLALEAAKAGAWEIDMSTGKAVTSARHDEIFGHRQIDGAWTLDRFADALAPEDRDQLHDQVRQAAAARTPLHLLARLRDRGGPAQPRWIEAWGRPAGPHGASYYGIVVDVSQRKRAEADLARAGVGLALAVEAAKLGRWEYDFSTGSFSCDDRLRRMFGGLAGVAPAQELAAFLARVDADDLVVLNQHAEAARRGVAEGRLECQFRLAPRAGEAPRWLHAFGQAVFEQERCIRLLGVCQDITGQKRDAAALRDLNATLEAEVAARTAERDRTWRLSQELLAVTVAGEGMVSVNPAWERVLGWSPAELQGRSLLDLVHPDDLAASTAETMRAVAGTISLQFRNRCRTREGAWRHISWTTVPEGRSCYLSGRDVTGLVDAAAALDGAQAQLRQMQKMEAVGQLTGGIAHDFNNMLSVVIGALSLIQRRQARGDHDIARFVEAAMDGARRAGALTQRLLAFSRQQPLQPRPLDLARLVGGMRELLERTLGETVRLALEVTGDGRDGVWVNVDPSQMENVILNLALNARDAMPAGGRLSITLASLVVAADDPPIGELGPGAFAELVISDTGTGMRSEVLARAFEPFFTTKAVGAGTGLGLSQAYGFARQSGGTALLWSQPGEGCRVTLLLPIEARAPDASAAAELPAAPASGGETVLLVEDDDRVRQTSGEALRDLGYRVIEADGAAAALRALSEAATVDLLFTDMVMPEVSGRDLAGEALRRRPGLKVLFTTGYERDAAAHHAGLGAAPAGPAEGGEAEGGEAVRTFLLPKPFSIEQLAAKLRDVLDRR